MLINARRCRVVVKALALPLSVMAVVGLIYAFYGASFLVSDCTLNELTCQTVAYRNVTGPEITFWERVIGGAFVVVTALMALLCLWFCFIIATSVWKLIAEAFYLLAVKVGVCPRDPAYTSWLAEWWNGPLEDENALKREY